MQLKIANMSVWSYESGSQEALSPPPNIKNNYGAFGISNKRESYTAA